MEVKKFEGKFVVSDEIDKLLLKNEKVLYKYEVVPLDVRVSDYFSPTFYISNTRLFFFVDEGVEIYSFDDLEINFLGEEPNFEIQKLVLESYPKYVFDYRKDLEDLKLKEGLCKISLNESKQIPKYFLVRSGFSIQKSYKTWALYMLLLNLKNKQTDNDLLVEMLSGYFSSFNQKTVLNFIFVFLGYFVVRIIAQMLLPDIFGTVLDVIFALILILLGYWLYLSSMKNFKKYYKYYLNNVSN